MTTSFCNFKLGNPGNECCDEPSSSSSSSSSSSLPPDWCEDENTNLAITMYLQFTHDNFWWRSPDGNWFRWSNVQCLNGIYEYIFTGSAPTEDSEVICTINRLSPSVGTTNGWVAFAWNLDEIGAVFGIGSGYPFGSRPGATDTVGSLTGNFLAAENVVCGRRPYNIGGATFVAEKTRNIDIMGAETCCPGNNTIVGTAEILFHTG